MFHSPQSNADDNSLICSTHPVRKFFGFHLRRFLIPLLLLASCGLMQRLSAQETKMRSERINLFGVPTDLIIQEDIPESERTWTQVREITLKYLDAQKQDKPSLRVAEKRLYDMQLSLSQKIDATVQDLAAKTGKSLEEVAYIFQSGEGSKIAPETQHDCDLMNGLYQIDTALKLKNKTK
jgi:hypothetical protein